MNVTKGDVARERGKRTRSLGPTLRGNRELIKVYVAAVNVYNCRGRGQVFYSRRQARAVQEASQRRLVYFLSRPAEALSFLVYHEIFRKIERPLYSVASNRLAAISRPGQARRGLIYKGKPLRRFGSREDLVRRFDPVSSRKCSSSGGVPL